MRTAALTLVATTALVAGCGGTASPPAVHEASEYGRAPLSFAPNAGEAPATVRYVARAGGTTMLFTRRAVSMAFSGPRRGLALQLRFAGADAHARLEAGAPDGGSLNYL